MRPVPGFGWEPLLDFRLGPAASYDWDELDVRAYFERTLRRTCSPNGIGAFKLMWDQVSDFAHGIRRSMRWRDQTSLDFARLLPEGTRYLWLVRRDTLRQAVSLSRAIQTGCWDSRAQREFTGLQLFDHRHVRALLKWVEHQNREWERFFRDNGINPLRLTYEEVVDDPPSAVVEIFRFLGIPAPPANEMRSEHLPLERQTDAVTEEWIRRFERVESSKSLARAWHMAWGYPRRLAGKALGTLRERRRRRRQFGITRHQRRAGRRALARG